MKTPKERTANTFVYVDEAGIFPLEEDNILVVAALAFRGHVADTLDKHTATLDAVLEKTEAHDGVMALCYVKPFEGFIPALNQKLAKLEVMARAARMAEGHHPYMSGDTLSARNMEWGFCIQMAILAALAGALVNGPVSLVDAIVDRKTMSDASMRYFNAQADKLPFHMHHLRKVPALRIVGVPTTIRVRLSNDPTAPHARGGLRLVDVISRHALRELREAGALSSFRNRDRREVIVDMTEALLEPIPQEAIEQYKRRTGRAEPHVEPHRDA